MSLYLTEEARAALFASIHRLAQEYVPGCTIEQVKKICNLLHGHGYTRQEAAFYLYWELSEKRIAEKSTSRRFLDMLASRCKDDAEKEQREQQMVASVKNFWTEEL